MKSKAKLATAISAAAMTGLIAGASATLVGGCHNKDNAGMSSSADMSAKHDCKGMNACKGQGNCKTGNNGCKGKNSCKGNGGCKSMDAVNTH